MLRISIECLHTLQAYVHSHPINLNIYTESMIIYAIIGMIGLLATTFIVQYSNHASYRFYSNDRQGQ